MAEQMTPLEAKALKNINRLRSHLLQFTTRLVAMDQQGDIIGISSGFLVKRGEDYVLLAAGHALKKKSWLLETDVTIDETHETVGIQISGIYHLEAVSLDQKSNGLLRQEIDFAFALLSARRLRSQMQSEQKLKHRRIELTAYLGPLGDEPIRGTEAYSYASWNKITYFRAFKSFVEREATSEFMMTYVGLTEDGSMYEFQLSRPHQGAAYYEGASGSPIVNPEGKVVSMLLGGDPDKNILYGLPIKNLVHVLDAGLLEEHSQPKD